jgi:hypothetical protein
VSKPHSARVRCRRCPWCVASSSGSGRWGQTSHRSLHTPSTAGGPSIPGVNPSVSLRTGTSRS